MTNIQESGEMYLETILVLSGQLPVVRSIDISKKMGFSKPSVSRAVKNLKEQNLIEISEDGGIILCPAGAEIAERIYERHRLLTGCLVRLGVPEKIASEDACRIEHVISSESFEAIKAHAAK